MLRASILPRNKNKRVAPSPNISHHSNQQTEKDKAISAYKAVYKAVKQIQTLVTAIRLPDSNTSKTQQKRDAKTSHQRLQQIQTRVSTIVDSLVTIAPIPGLQKMIERDTIDQRLLTKRSREQQGLPPKDMSSIETLVEEIDEEDEKENCPPAKRADRKSSRRIPLSNIPHAPFPIPKLAPGKKIYSPAEIIPHFAEAKKVKQGVSLLAYLLDLNLLPKGVTIHIINKKVAKFKQSPALIAKEHFWDLGNRGRPRLIETQELQEKAIAKIDSSGKTIGRDDIRNILVEKKKEDIHDRGLISHVPDRELVSERAVDMYVCQLAGASNGLTVVGSTNLRKKPENRMIAEASLRALASQIVCVGATHFHIGDSFDTSFNEKVRDMPQLDQDFCDMVGKALGSRYLLTCIEPHFGITNDCTTNYFYDDPKTIHNDEVRLATQESLAGRRTKSLHSVEKDDPKLGVKAKHRFCMSNTGAFAGIHITIPDLSERELPKKECPTGLLALSIPGLSPGLDSSLDMSSEGFLVFQRKGAEGLGKKRYRHIRDSLFFPFVERLRKAHSLLWDGNAESLTNAQRVVSWTDCDNDQTTEIIADLQPYHRNMVTVNQHNPARTGVEQAADLGNVFPAMKSGYKNINTSPEPTPLGNKLAQIFSVLQRDNVLNLSAPKKRILIKNLQQTRGIYARALATENIVKGALKNGMIDEKNHCIPSFTAMLATHSKTISKEAMKLIVETLPTLLQIFIEQGHIPETIFDEMGYPNDMHSDGKIFAREAGITREYLQRSKTLNHSFQIELREEKNAAIRKKHEDSLKKKQETFQLHLDRNAVCEGLLLATGVATPRVDLDLVGEDTFSSRKITKDTLVSFLKVRGVEVKSGSKKEVVAEKAFLSRHLPVLPLPTANPPPAAFTIPPVATHFPLAATQLRKPSNLAENAAWVSRLLCSLGIEPTEGNGENVSPQKIAQADKFYQMLLPRLQSHLDIRLNRNKHSHWLIVEFIIPNLAYFALLMVLRGHVRDNFVGVGPKECLLNPDADHFDNSGMENLHGAYLYYDQAKRKFVRSGKVTGRPFSDRHKEHEKASKNITAESSRFYLSYPHSTSAIQPDSKIGKFEDLKQVVALGVSLTEFKLWTVSADDSGVLHIPTSVLNKISVAKGFDRGNQRPSLTEKTMHMVSYLAELVYDLCIPENDNVSESFGFEAVMRPDARQDIGAEPLP